MPILTKENFNENDYKIILEQTGIYSPAVDELKKEPTFIGDMLEFQEKYYAPIDITKTNMSFITRWDRVMHSGKPQKVFELAPYKNGDIFLTKSTYTFNWRHGHAGIVVDDVNGYILESLNPGSVSKLQKIENWEYYTTFKMLRPKGISQEMRDNIATYALQNLKGIPYNILAIKNFEQPTKITHCSHIIWQAYIPFKMDIDNNGGIFIPPHDIARSDLFEPVQIFGFNPERAW
ncbi:hypothetical protein AN641_06025 [Candidatus Epulonipiscioides gigas]|nr:hypothetical protein AN641_06025 [Epulopiscium sp. SCG-C07WGA-EpuloA2]